MPIKSSVFLTNDDTIEKVAPPRKGVYALYDQFAGLIYYGSTENIQASIFDHKYGKTNRTCTWNASYFSFEECKDPFSREKELLEEYKKLNKKLPLCNEVTY
jgi:hypothetical protein